MLVLTAVCIDSAKPLHYCYNSVCSLLQEIKRYNFNLFHSPILFSIMRVCRAHFRTVSLIALIRDRTEILRQ
jgi:hypothetical protein